ncbi:MAG: TRAP transporter large permease [Chloroflexota bacterium]|nr:TRAP transporter large permease [Chloroflexota bacterium]
MVWAGIALIIVLFFLGAPIFVAFGSGASIICLWYLGIPPEMVGMKLWESLNSFTLLAIPMFIIAGNFMAQGGAARHLVNFINSLIGHTRGGLAMVIILTSAFFACLCGSTIATVAAVGAIMFPMMVESGYSRRLSTSAIAMGATLGPIIPPSTWMILYGPLTGTNVAELFAAGIIPGILIALAFLPMVRHQAIKEKTILRPAATWGERGRSFVKAIPAILMPIIILGGIYGGIFTPTEAAAVAAIYSLIIGFAVYRGLNLRTAYAAVADTVRTLGALLLLVVSAILFGFVLAQIGIPRMISGAVAAAGFSPAIFLVIFCVILVILGMFVEGIALLLILAPLFYPTAVAMDINLVHFGLLFVVGLCIGQVSPPFGTGVFTLSAFTGEPSESIFKGVLPLLGIEVAILFILALVPQISLWLPNMMR